MKTSSNFKLLISFVLTGLAVNAQAAESLKSTVMPWTYNHMYDNVDFSKDGTLAIVEGNNNGVTEFHQTVWNVSTNELVAVGTTDPTNDASLKFFGNTIVKTEGPTDKEKGPSVISNFVTGKKIGTLANWEYLYQVASSGKSDKAVTVQHNSYGYNGPAQDDVVNIYDSLSESKVSYVLEGTKTTDGADEVVVSEDGKLMAYSTKSSAVLMNLETGKVVMTVNALAKDINPGVGLSNDGKRFYTFLLSEDQKSSELAIWDTTSLKKINNRIFTSKLNKDGEEVGFVGGEIQSLKEGTEGLIHYHRSRHFGYIDMKTGAVSAHTVASSKHGLNVIPMKGNVIASAASAMKVGTFHFIIQALKGTEFKTIYEIGETKEIKYLEGDMLSASPNGKCLAMYYSNTKKLNLVNPTNPSKVWGTLDMDLSGFTQFSPDGKFIFSHVEDNGESAKIIRIDTPVACQNK